MSLPSVLSISSTLKCSCSIFSYTMWRCGASPSSNSLTLEDAEGGFWWTVSSFLQCCDAVDFSRNATRAQGCVYKE